MQLAKDVGEKVSSLLTLINELANYDPDDPQTIDLDTAGAKCADAAQGLLACTKVCCQHIIFTILFHWNHYIIKILCTYSLQHP